MYLPETGLSYNYRKDFHELEAAKLAAVWQIFPARCAHAGKAGMRVG